MSDNRDRGLLNGAFILLLSTAVVKVIGALYKIPLTGIIGATGRGYFSTAYNIYTPLYAISMAGLPVAVSRMVAEKRALGQYRDIKRIFSVAFRSFLLTGTLGTAVLLAFAYPYVYHVARTPGALWCVLAVAPSIFFCCLMSSYRGYYEGLGDMRPTGISQVTESVVKLFLGIGFAYAVKQYGMSQYFGSGTVFGAPVGSETEALAAVSPYASAGAVLGVTVGTFAGLVCLIGKKTFGGDGITAVMLGSSPAPSDRAAIRRALIAIAVPVVVGSLISNVTNLIDAATIQNRLAQSVSSGRDIIASQYGSSLAGMSDMDMSTYLYGCYNAALDFKNLIPTITVAIGVSAIPVLSGAWALRDANKIKNTVESVIRVTLLIALPAGFGMAVTAKPILTLMYGATQPDLISAALPVMSSYCWAVGLISVSGPVTSMLHAIGRPDVPIASVILGSIVKIASNYLLVGRPEINIKGAPYGSILCYVVIVAYDMYFLCRETKLIPNPVTALVKPLFASGLSAAAAYAAYGQLSRGMSNSASLSITIIIAALIYIIVLLLTRTLKDADIIMLPCGKKLLKVLAKCRLIG